MELILGAPGLSSCQMIGHTYQEGHACLAPHLQPWFTQLDFNTRVRCQVLAFRAPLPLDKQALLLGCRCHVWGCTNKKHTMLAEVLAHWLGTVPRQAMSSPAQPPPDLIAPLITPSRHSAGSPALAVPSATHILAS